MFWSAVVKRYAYLYAKRYPALNLLKRKSQTALLHDPAFVAWGSHYIDFIV